MKDDPIVAEVHQARQELLAECDGDLNKLMDRLQEREDEARDLLINSAQALKPRAITVAR